MKIETISREEYERILESSIAILRGGFCADGGCWLHTDETYVVITPLDEIISLHRHSTTAISVFWSDEDIYTKCFVHPHDVPALIEKFHLKPTQ